MPFDSAQTPMTTVEKLEHLFRIVEAVPDLHFDMSTWMNECHTAGCMLGWACLDPTFSAMGLRLEQFVPLVEGGMCRAPVFAGYQGFGAGAAFFGIDFTEAAELFTACQQDLGGCRSISKMETLIKLRALITTCEVRERMDRTLARVSEVAW